MSPPTFPIPQAPPPIAQARGRLRPPAQPRRSSGLRSYRLKHLQPTAYYDATAGTATSVSAVDGEAFNALGATLAQVLDPQEGQLI